MAISAQLEVHLLRAFLGEVHYLSLHSADPAKDGGEEIGANRQIAPLELKEEGNNDERTCCLQLASDVLFLSLPRTTLRGFGLWDAPVRGNYLWGGEFASGQEVKAGEGFRIPAGMLTLRIF